MVLTASCFHTPSIDDGGANTSTTSAAETSAAATDPTGGCVDGLEGCPCITGGLCVAGLVCASQLCVDLGGVDDTQGADGADGGTSKPSDTGEPVTTGEDTGTTGEPASCVGRCDGSAAPGTACYCDTACMSLGDCCPDYVEACGGAACLSNDDCGALEVCSPTMGCRDAFGATYDVVVDDWRDHTTVCWDVDDCLADVYYDLYYAGEQVFESSTVADVVQASWSEPATFAINDLDVLSIAFADEDLDADDAMITVCFLADLTCGPVPVDVLHAGTYAWDDDSFAVSVRFLAH